MSEMLQGGITGTEAQSADTPHPETVARIAARLANVASDPASLALVGADIQTYGIGAFLHAVQQKVAADSQATPTVTADLTLSTDLLQQLGLRRGDEGVIRDTWT